jgi:DNA invertase Pin-like site-specific DNA recombinase
MKRAAEATRRAAPALIAAVGYARMSTDKQDCSIADQKSKVEEWAGKNGYRITRWYVDEAISGFDENRENFQRMVNDVRTIRDFEAIICWNQKRFARFDVLDTAQYWKILRDAEIKLLTVCEGLISFDSIASILTAVINQDSANRFLVDLGAEICSKQELSARAGYWPNSKPPDGYVSKPAPDNPRYRKLSIDDERAAIIRRIFDLYLSGGSQREIATRLNADGLRTPKGNKWSGPAIRNILTNEAYTGALIYGRRSCGKHFRRIDGERTRVTRRDCKAIRNDRAAWIIVPNAHPAIIDSETFKRAESLAAGRKKDCRRGPSKVSPISGLCVCGHCGGKAGVCSGAKNRAVIWRGLRCNSAKLSKDIAPDCRYCIALDLVISRVIRQVEADYLSEEKITQYRAAITKYLGERRNQTEAASARLSKAIDDIDAKLRKAEARLADVPDDMEQALYRQIRELRDRKQQAEVALTAECRMSEISEKVVADHGAALVARLRDIKATIRAADPAKARAAFEAIIDRVIIFTAPVTKRKPGQGNGIKRELSRVKIEYRSPICLLESTRTCAAWRPELRTPLDPRSSDGPSAATHGGWGRC